MSELDVQGQQVINGRRRRGRSLEEFDPVDAVASYLGQALLVRRRIWLPIAAA